MNKNILYIVLCSVWINTYGQKRQLTLVIDTLKLNQLNVFRPATTGIIIDEELGQSWAVYDSVKTENQSLNFNTYPNYSAKIIISNDSTELLIPFDDGGGYLSLLNSANLQSDTLRISSWTIYPNCYNDTISTTTNYWKVNYQGGLTEDLGALYKKKTKVKIVKKKCDLKLPATIHVSINRRQYDIQLGSPQSIEEILSIGCGYPDYKPGWDTNPPKNKVLRHARETKCIKTINVLVLKLKGSA